MLDLAVAYVRVSSKNQDVDRQKNELKEYALAKEFKIEKYFEDFISASKSNINDRKGFNELKRYLSSSKKKIKHILVHEVSRLGRKNFEVQNAIEEFYQLGVNIHFRDLNKSTLDENGNKSPESSIIISILGSMAENETRLLADRIKSGLLNSAKKGLAFSDKITGYKKGLDGRPIIDEQDAPLVRRMYELAAKETTLYFISKKIYTEFDREINSRTISGIIKNPFYKGERKYLGETILVDKIVDKEVWELANNFLLSRKKFTTRYHVYENIVEGKIECYKCGSPMYQIVIKSGRCNIFKCSNKCSISVNRPWLYEMIRYVVDKHTKKINNKVFKVNLKRKIEDNELLISDLTSRRIEIESAQILNYERFLMNKVKESMYDKVNKSFEKELKRIELNLKKCKTNKTSYKAALKSKPQHYSDDLKTFKVQIQNILKEVEVDKNYIILNIGNVIKYTIPQLNGTELGWIKRKNGGRKMIFESPFKTGIKIRNYINDEELDSMVNEYLMDKNKLKN